MVLKYIPEICRDSSSGVTGHLMLTMLPYPERNRLRKEICLFSNKKFEDDMLKKIENLEMGSIVADRIFPLIVEVDLVLGDKSVVKDAEGLYAHPDCEDIVTELVSKYLFGFAEKNS